MRMSYTEWQGAPGYEIAIPIVFDGLHRRESQEQRIHKLELLALPSDKFTPLRPPRLQFDTKGDVPHDRTRAPRKRWVIAGTGLEWLDYISVRMSRPSILRGDQSQIGGRGGGRNDPSGARRDVVAPHAHFKRVQAQCIVHMWEWIGDEVLTVSLHKRKYHVPRGETLQKIALKFYGSPNEWRRIAKLNHIRDPNHIKPGTIIKLP